MPVEAETMTLPLTLHAVPGHGHGHEVVHEVHDQQPATDPACHERPLHRLLDRLCSLARPDILPVSYTHLTLPTNREV